MLLVYENENLNKQKTFYEKTTFRTKKNNINSRLRQKTMLQAKPKTKTKKKHEKKEYYSLSLQ